MGCSLWIGPETAVHTGGQEGVDGGDRQHYPGFRWLRSGCFEHRHQGVCPCASRDLLLQLFVKSAVASRHCWLVCAPSSGASESCNAIKAPLPRPLLLFLKCPENRICYIIAWLLQGGKRESGRDARGGGG